MEERTKLEIEDLGNHPRGYAILLHACIFGLYQVLPASAQVDKDLAAPGS